MNSNLFVVIAASAIFYGTPLYFAALGEVLTERSGVLNLGVEGMMLMGAVTAASTSIHAPGPTWFALLLAVLAGMVAAGALALLHAFLVVTLRVNQVVSGLAITILAGGAGLSSYLASVWGVATGPVPHQLSSLDVLGLGDLPVLGPIVFDQNALTYLSWAALIGTSWYLFRTRRGLELRAVGESPATADAMGIDVTRSRYLHTVVGGMLAGVGGAYFTLAIVPTWTDGVTAGRGWIAIALVIFGFWRPDLTLLGAYLFGAFSSLAPTLQTRGVDVPVQLLDSLPYLTTVVVLVAVSSGWASRRVGAPAALGTAYEREDR
ncbi:MAG TPA: ABC transporter permease [Acidimicrobiales bacterium]|nr:ABC transporter permease [Acidimicrobiales bacterium]